MDLDSLIAQIFNVVTVLAMLLLFLRFLMQLTQADPYNPIVMSTVRATHIVDVFSRILPTVGQGRVNLAAIALMILVRLVYVAGTYLINGMTNVGPDVLFVELSFGLIDGFLWMCKILIYVSIFSSLILLFTQSPTPFVMLVMQMTEPLYAPIRRLMPDLGPIDLSPLVVLILISVLRSVLSMAHGVLQQSLM